MAFATTFSFNSVSDEEWEQVLAFVTTGGPTLLAYDEFKKVEVEDGVYKVLDRGIALRHRMSIGTITSDTSIRVKFLKGGYIGTVEESFASRLDVGDVFWLKFPVGWEGACPSVPKCRLCCAR